MGIHGRSQKAKTALPPRKLRSCCTSRRVPSRGLAPVAAALRRLRSSTLPPRAASKAMPARTSRRDRIHSSSASTTRQMMAAMVITASVERLKLVSTLS